MTADQTTPAPPPQAAKPPVVRRIARILAGVVLSLIILIALVFLFTQTAWFRGIVADRLISTVASETNGELAIGEIGGDLFSGFVIRNVRLTLKNDTATIFEAPVMLAKYSLYDLLTGERIAVSELVLTQPKITFFREEGDSLWNFQKLIKPSEAPADTAKFRGIIELGNLRIHDGSLTVRDLYTGRPVIKERPGAIDWGYMNVEQLDADLRVSIFGADYQTLDLENVSFYERRSGFALRRLAGYISRNEGKVDIEGLNLVTNETALKLTVRADSLKALTGGLYEDMANSPVEAHLDATAISAKELAAFIPELDFLGSVPALKLDAKGTFGDLQIETGELNLRRQGTIGFKGSLGSLNDPERLRLDVSLAANNLSQTTLDNYVPGLAIKGFERYGSVNIRRLEYHGSVQSFATRFDIITTTAGGALGAASLDFSGAMPRYTASINTSNLNLSALAAAENLKSSLNVKLDVRGAGFDLSGMNTAFVVSLTSPSTVGGYTVSSFAAHGALMRGTLDASDVVLSLGENRLLTFEHARVDLVGGDHAFDIAGSTKNFPLAEFIPGLPAAIRVTADADMSGSFASLAGVSGTLTSEVGGLRFKGIPLAPVRIDATLGTDSLGMRLDRIESSIAEVTVKGNYHLNELAALIPRRIVAVIHALDTSAPMPEPEPAYGDTERIDLRLELKDLRPLDFIWDNLTFLSQAKMSALFTRYPGGRIDADISGTVPALMLQSESDTAGSLDLRIYDTTHLLLDVANFTSDPQTLLDSLRATFVIRTDSALRFAGVSYDKPKATIEFAERDFSFDIGTGIGDLFKVYLRGGGALAITTFDVALDSLALQVNDVLWQSRGQTHLRFDPNGYVALDTLTLWRPELGYDPEGRLAQRVEVGAALRNDTIEYAFVHAPQLKLNELPMYFPDSAPGFAHDLRGRISKLDVDIDGTLTHPSITGNLLIRNFTYQEIYLDSLVASFDYDNLNLQGRLRLHVDSARYAIEGLRAGRRITTIAGKNGLDVTIDSLPVVIAFGDYPERDRDETLAQSSRVALRAEGKDFPVDLLSPILPFLTDLSGFADLTLDARGTKDNLLLTGEATILNGSFTLSTTNVPYTFTGTVEFARDRLNFPNIIVSNLPSDDPSGIGFLTGNIDLEGFSIRNIDFRLTTERLTVLTNESRETLETIYGPLAIQSGGRPIRIYGTLDAPHLDGDVIIPQAYLTMPQQQDIRRAEDKGIIYRLLDIRETILGDTTTRDDTLRAALEFEPTLYDELDRFATPVAFAPDTSVVREPQTAGAQATSGGYDFLDALLYDNVTVTIPGDAWLIVYMNQTYFGDQLSAEIRSEGPVRIHRERPGPENLVFTGTLTLTERSSYKFLKEFSPVKGTIRFFNEMTNPRLDISAEYIGPHAVRSNETYKVIIRLTGFLDNPIVQLELYRKNDLTGTFDREQRSQDELTADVLLFLATGKFRRDQPSSLEFSKSLTSVPSTIVNALFSNALGSTALRNYIRTISIEQGSTIDSTRIRLAGGYKDLSWKFGSSNRGFQNFLAGDYLLEIPLSTALTFNNARNHIIQLEGHFQDPTFQSTLLSQQQRYVGRYIFRIPLE